MSEALEVVTTLPALRRDLMISPVMDLELAKSRMKQFQEFVAHYLEPSTNGGLDGGDYGPIPGAGSKKVLLKSGADKLCELYGLYDEYEIEAQEDFAINLFYYKIKCILKSRRDDSVVGTGVGSCSTFESKYRWRDSQRVCPKCKNQTIIKGKDDFGGGWLCWAKKGGCGAKFKDGDQSIEGQTIGRVENPDIMDTVNTVLKMAKKRAKIDAVIGVTRSSGIFTQDMEDVPMPPPKPEVARTTEDIEIKPKSASDIGSRAIEGSQDTTRPQGADIHSSTGPVSTGLAESGPTSADKPAPAIPGADCIDAGQAANFERMFKDALPAKYRKHARELAHDWLRYEKIFDVLGAPSAYGIKKESFYDVREKALEYAKSYQA